MAMTAIILNANTTCRNVHSMKKGFLHSLRPSVARIGHTIKPPTFHQFARCYFVQVRNSSSRNGASSFFTRYPPDMKQQFFSSCAINFESASKILSGCDQSLLSPRQKIPVHLRNECQGWRRPFSTTTGNGGSFEDANECDSPSESFVTSHANTSSGDPTPPVVESDSEGGGEDGSIEEEEPQEVPPIPCSVGESKPPRSSSSLLKRQKSPHEVVKELDQHIVGQADAKRAVAIALRNRWRRKQLPSELQKEVTPRNVLMIGPTGCGKTEVARRMADLGGAPFLKVEATKFTEVGYHGKDVDQIIRDLVEVSIKLTRKQKREALKEELEPVVEEKLLNLVMGNNDTSKKAKRVGSEGEKDDKEHARNSFREMLREGHLDGTFVQMDVPIEKNTSSNDAFMNSQNIVAMISAMGVGDGNLGGSTPKTEKKKIAVQEAREILMNMECDKAMDKMDLKKEAIKAVEESGIVYLDEIDKICTSRNGGRSSSDASDEGVQRDLLPLVEGTTISTKHGNVNTDYILFIASGAFHSVKPSDMLPELQGRLPIRVNLAGLTENDLYRILTEPVANLIRQQTELLATEGVELEFTDEAKREIARMAAQVNRTVENIGARRLYTVMERIMEEISFDAGNDSEDSEEGTKFEKITVEDEEDEEAVHRRVVVTQELVQKRLGDLVANESDLRRYIL